MVKHSAIFMAIAIASLVGIQGCSSTGNTPTPNSSPDTVESPANPSETPVESQQPQNAEIPPQNRVKVFFPNPEKGEDRLDYVEPVWRRTDSMGVGAFAIAQLIKGPTSQEQNLGLESALTLNGPSNCGGEDFQLAIQDKVAKLQLCREVVSAGIGDDARAKSALTATLTQFPSVEKAVIINSQGDCFGDMSGENRCLSQLKDPNNTKTPKQLNNNTRLALTRFGPIEIGMTIPKASEVAGIPFQQQPSGGEEYGCLYYNLEPKLDGVAVMVTENRIARIDITSSTIKTLSGAGVGSTEAEIRRLYPGQIESEGHTYDPNGKYLIFVPEDAKHRNYRVIFETDGSGTVQRFRSGQLPEVGYIEGCV